MKFLKANAMFHIFLHFTYLKLILISAESMNYLLIFKNILKYKYAIIGNCFNFAQGLCTEGDDLQI